MSHQASAQCLNCMWKMVHTLVFVEGRSSKGMEEARIYTGDDKVLLRVMVDCHIEECSCSFCHKVTWMLFEQLL